MKNKIYIFSNVKYPRKNRIRPEPGDMLVFLNSAVSASYYLGCPNIRFCYHRSPEPDYGQRTLGCINNYVFDAHNLGYGIPADFVERLKASYDWDYPIETEKNRCMTTGYMVVKWIEYLFPESDIILVNFGFEVKHSTYRCPWHNWRYEADRLQTYQHIYTEV